MADSRQRAIIKVFRKYSHSLGPEVLDFLEDVLDKHEIADEEVESSMDLVAKEYNKQDDATMKVSLEVLQRVYEVLQGMRQGQSSSQDEEPLDPDGHLHFIDAYDMPLWHWSNERSTFDRSTSAQTISGSADSRVSAMRDRLNIIRQTVMRNEHFSPSTLPSRDREHLLTLRSTKQLLGRPGERFLLLGMLAHNKEGKLCLEDADGSVELDFSQLDQPSEGLFTEGSFALVEGDYTDDATLIVIAIGHPPCESRETARSIFGHIDFLGKGATTLLEDAQYAVRIQRDLPDLNFFFLSDVWLDHPTTLRGLRKMFDNCVESNFVPKVIVLCGNFSSKSISQGSAHDIQKYQENFESLADLILSYPILARTAHFALIPGPHDMTANTLLPRRPLLSSFVSKLRDKVPNIHIGTNPCRIKFYGQEIVIYREDIMARMLRNLVGVKPDVRTDDLKRYTVLDQSHLTPLTVNIQPTLSEFDHSLRLYPLPTAVVLADKYDNFQMTYEGCHVFNPGRFVGKSFSFSTYAPARRESESW
ncbi:DNA polymerase epsilon subunit B [Punctularia strigosozonata HHB-11173 SS5]|uniref:DNA polymerase epsilon subunit B n=1 Tax=Punctularia strigosozonata (strain HHB-11173) TaxID=741275 RepID=UPI0004417146|nr:DNA polymerase epsilon subunit B [Punctularia strigosozonata HHB-11173 SS5]EIN10433.1 DNA polymerase epsilon subunit B [Punctularia strigosozonata HHB-11173 SS5]